MSSILNSITGFFKSAESKTESSTDSKSQPASQVNYTNTDQIKNVIENYKKNFRKEGYQNIFHTGSKPKQTDKLLVVQQLVFILDITGSMGAYIKSTKEQITKFIGIMNDEAVEEFKKDYADRQNDVQFVFEVAIVCYRDFRDKCLFETHDFTYDIFKLSGFLSDITVSGGDDAPEDVKGGFLHALTGIDSNIPRLSWNKYPEVCSRSIIWLADSPPHGTSMVSGGDYYPHDDCGWDEIFEEMKNMGIDFNIMRLDAINDKANAVFKNLSEKHGVSFDLIDVSQSIDKTTRNFDGCTAYESASTTLSVKNKTNTKTFISTKFTK